VLLVLVECHGPHDLLRREVDREVAGKGVDGCEQLAGDLANARSGVSATRSPTVTVLRHGLVTMEVQRDDERP